MSEKEEISAKISKTIEDFLRSLGHAPGKNPELLHTPTRVASLWLDDLLDGYNWDPSQILKGGSSFEGAGDIVIVRDLFFHSTCPHHLLPFHGLAHVAYIPRNKIIGFSKIARLVDCFTHRLTLQEEAGKNIAKALVEHLDARWAACMLDAEQLCMVIRGVRKPGVRSVTAGFAGKIEDENKIKSQFYSAISNQSD